MVTAMPGTDATLPDPDPHERLEATRFQVGWVSETGSTNADLLEAAAAGAADGTVLVADHQTAGRGRRDRTWEAPPGSSLLVSVLLRPGRDPEQSAALTAAVGLAARHACAAVAGVEVALKWPNDLVAPTGAGERKVGGILAESRVAGEELEAVVVGLGLNVDWPDPVPAPLDEIAVALNHLGAEAVDRTELVVELLVDLESRLRTIEAGHRAAMWSEWREASATLGRRIRVETVTDRLTGQAEDITDLGRLVVRTDAGEEVEIGVGDVVHLRAVP